MVRISIRGISNEVAENVAEFIDELGLIPSCFITPCLAREYHKELVSRLRQDRENRVLSSIERELISQALVDMHNYNNNRLHRWHKGDPLYPQLSFENFD